MMNYMNQSIVPGAQGAPMQGPMYGQNILEFLRKLGIDPAQFQQMQGNGMGAPSEMDLRAMREQAMGTGGWDGVNAKLQWMGQRAAAARAAAKARIAGRDSMGGSMAGMGSRSDRERGGGMGAMSDREQRMNRRPEFQDGIFGQIGNMLFRR